MHKLESVLNNETCKILRDFRIQMDHRIPAKRLHEKLIKKKKRTCQVDFNVQAVKQSVYFTASADCVVFLLGNAEYLFIAITLARSGSTWWSPINGTNRTKLCNYAKLDCLK